MSSTFSALHSLSALAASRAPEPIPMAHSSHSHSSSFSHPRPQSASFSSATSTSTPGSLDYSVSNSYSHTSSLSPYDGPIPSSYTAPSNISTSLNNDMSNLSFSLQNASISNGPSNGTAKGKHRRMSSSGGGKKGMFRAYPTPSPPVSASLPASSLLLPPKTRRASTTKKEPVIKKERETQKDNNTGGGKRNGPTYVCEDCNKVYRHRSCMDKHRWEHSPHWLPSSRFLLSKHQQVQLLEAAAILSHLSAPAGPRSLPEDRSLWPAYLSSSSPSTSYTGREGTVDSEREYRRYGGGGGGESVYDEEEEDYGDDDETEDEIEILGSGSSASGGWEGVGGHEMEL